MYLKRQISRSTRQGTHTFRDNGCRGVPVFVHWLKRHHRHVTSFLKTCQSFDTRDPLLRELNNTKSPTGTRYKGAHAKTHEWHYRFLPRVGGRIWCLLRHVCSGVQRFMETRWRSFAHEYGPSNDLKALSRARLCRGLDAHRFRVDHAKDCLTRQMIIYIIRNSSGRGFAPVLDWTYLLGGVV